MQLSTPLIALTLLAGSAAGQSWNTYPSKPNDWVNYTASVAEQGGENQIFVFGGHTETSIESDVYRYHRTTFWSGPLAPMPGARDRATSATALNDLGQERIYVFGGRSSSSWGTDDVWAYDPVNDLWETGLTPMPTARAEACAVTADDGWIYVFGGILNGVPKASVERYRPSTDTWEVLPDMAFPRYSFGAVAHCDSFLYLFGGETGSGQTTDVAIFNPGGGFFLNNQHTAAPPTDMLWSRSSFGCATGRNGHIYLIGGTTAPSPVGTNSVHKYNPWTDTWTIEPDLPTSRAALSAVGMGSRVWALGGYRKVWPTTAALEAYGDLWVNGSCIGVVPSLPPFGFGNVAHCDDAYEWELDGGTVDIGIVGQTSAWIDFELAPGESVELEMRNHAGDDSARILCYGSCGAGQVLGASQGTGPGEQLLSYRNDTGAPLKAKCEITWPGDPAEVLTFDIDLRRYYETLGNSYCGPAVPNSTGNGGVLIAAGDTAVAENDLTLIASQLPTNQFGYFLASQTSGFVQNPGGSQGNLCLGGQIARFSQQAASTGNLGELELTVDLFEMPTSPVSAVQPGETWNFQTWFRDKNPATTSNFTDAVSVTFQ